MRWPWSPREDVSVLFRTAAPTYTELNARAEAFERLCKNKDFHEFIAELTKYELMMRVGMKNEILVDNAQIARYNLFVGTCEGIKTSLAFAETMREEFVRLAEKARTEQKNHE